MFYRIQRVSIDQNRSANQTEIKIIQVKHASRDALEQNKVCGFLENRLNTRPSNQGQQLVRTLR